MANSDSPRGLLSIRHRNGAPYTGSASLYHKAAGDATPLFPGDPVVVTGTASVNGIPTVTRAAGGTATPITGIFVSRTAGDGAVLQDDPLDSPANTEDFILVLDDPDVVFEVQVDGAFAVTDISFNANLVAAAGSSGKSGYQVDSTTFAADAAHQVKVLRLVRREDNEVGVNAKIEVMINNHTQAHNTAGI